MMNQKLCFGAVLASIGCFCLAGVEAGNEARPARSPVPQVSALATQKSAPPVFWDGLRLTPRQIRTVTLSGEEAAGLVDPDCPACGEGQKLRIGLTKPVNELFSLGGDARPLQSLGPSRLLVRTLAGGRQIATAGFHLPAASAVKLRFHQFRLEPGWEVYLYTPGGEVRGPFRRMGPNRTGTFWSPLLQGPTVFVEFRSPAGLSIREAGQAGFEVSDVAFIGMPPGAAPPESDDFGSTVTPLPMLDPNAPCVEDARCYDGVLPPVPDEGGGIVGLDEVLRGAVGFILFEESGSYYICSGGLVNDTVAGSFIPYFLTANHCISTEESAQSAEVFWQYQTSACGAAYPSPWGFASSVGATLLASSSQSDFTLMLLSENPPPGSYFLGWTSTDYSEAGGTEIYRFSHPLGSPQSYSRHVISAVPTPGVCWSLPQGDFIYSKTDIGGTEGGSSGSPVVLASGAVVGQLYGACGNNVDDPCDSEGNSTVDGSFATSSTYVAQWLAPGGATGGVFPPVFSPNDDLLHDTVRFYLSLTAPETVTVDVLDARNQLVDRLVDAQALDAGAYEFDWEGNREDGSAAEDGMYHFEAWGPGIGSVTSQFGLNNTIPQVSRSWFLAEGSTVGFEAYALIQNPGDVSNPVTVTFFNQDGSTRTYQETVPPRTRTTVAIHGEVPGVYSVSTRVEGTHPIVVERAMYTPGQEAAHNSPGSIQTSTDWYFPMNRTFPGDESFILVVNPGDTSAHLTARFFTDNEEPLTQSYTVGATSRYTIPVHAYFHGQYVSVELTSDRPVAAERAFYFSSRDGAAAGTGAVSGSLTWFFAEGDTADATTELHLLNAGDSSASVDVEYLLESGTVILRSHQIPARRRLTLDSIAEIGSGRRFSMRMTSTLPVVAERLMFSGSDAGSTVGTPTTALTWDLAEGFTAFGFETWILVSNPGSTSANVTVRFQQQNSDNVVNQYVLPPNRRLTVYANDFVDPTSISTQVVSDAPIVVERTMKFGSRRGMHQSMGIID